MISETTLAPVPDEAAVEQLEAEFLRGEVLAAALPSGIDPHSLDIGQPAGDEVVMYMTRYRTRRGCCGG